MTINDRVYGKLKVNSACLIELIKSRSVQRLKGISQFGIPDDYYHHKNYSRLEHSVGVMLLLKRLGASEEEQIAGLLHDVSHTAFSHVIDWVISDGSSEDYQDEQHETYVNKSEIPKILKKYGYSTDRIVDYHHFGLLERAIPDLCADRIDYSLREFPASLVRKCLPSLAVSNGRIVFVDQAVALAFANNFLKLQMEHWGGFEAASRYRIFANLLRYALDMGVVTKADFWQNDDFIINKLGAKKDEGINKILRVLKNKSLSDLEKSGTKVHKKFRYVDPLTVVEGKTIRLSKVDKKFANEIQKARRVNQLGIEIPHVANLNT